jgi:hypothetical protein
MGLVVEGEAGGDWWLVRREGCWEQLTDCLTPPSAVVTLPQEIAWKVWTKRWPIEEKLRAWPGIGIEGEAELGRVAVGMVSVMA